MARTIRDEVLRWNLVINGDSARKELNDLNHSQAKIQARIKELEKESNKLIKAKKTETEQYRVVEAELKQLNATYQQQDARVQALQAEIGITSKTMSQLRNEAKNLSFQLSKTVPDTKEYRDLEARLKAVTARMDELRGKSVQAEFSIGKMADKMNRYATMGAAVIATTTGIVLSLQKYIDTNAELADQQANVMKTTGLTREEVAELSREFDSFNTRTPRMELLKLAEEAGRLGKSSKFEVMEFVRTANMIKVALGDDLGDETAIRDVGKLTEQFQIGAKHGVSFGRAMEMLGSAINEVSASGNNMAPFLVDFSKRVAGIDQQVGMGAGNIIGYAAALDEAGQSAETSSTVFNRVIPNMFKDPATYARIAKIEVGEFTRLLRTDANEALLRFFEGLKGQNEGFDVMAKKFDGLGLDGARAVSVLAALANNTEKVRERQKMANEALQEGTSLVQEYTIKNNNFAASMAKISREMYRRVMSSSLADGMRSMADAAARYLEIPLSATLEKERRELRAVEMQLLTTNLKSEDRVKLIKQLKEQYPTYLAQIDAEKTSSNELFKAIQRINDELINKIILQKNDEKIQQQNERIAMKRMQVIEAENKLRAEAIRLAEKQNLPLPSGTDVIDQALTLSQQLKRNEILTGVAFDPTARFRRSIYELQLMRRNLNNLEKEGNNMISEREKLIERLGIKMQEVATTQQQLSQIEGGEGESLTLEEIREKRDAAHKALLLDVDTFLKNEQALHAEARAQGLMTEEQYQEGLQRMQHTAFTMRREALAAYLAQLGTDEVEKRQQTEGQIADIRKQAAELEMRDMVDFAAWSEAFLEDHFKKVNEINEAEYAKLKERNARLRREALISAEIDILNSAPGSRAEVQARKRLLEVQHDLELENTLLTEQEKELIRLQYLERMRDLETGYIKENARIALQSFNALASSMTALTNNRLQKELDEERQMNDAKKQDLRRQLDSRLISEETYRTRLAALEDEYMQTQREIKTEQFKRQRNADALQAGINTALAISRALPNIPLSIAAGVMGTAQIASILATPIPAFKHGKYNKYPVTTTEGKRYNATYSGPVKTGVYSKPTVGLFGEDGKEIVISGPHVRHLEMNYPEIIDAILSTRTPAFARGKYEYESNSQYRKEGRSRKSSRRAMQEMNRGQDIMIEELKEIRQILSEMRENPIPAEMSWRQYSDFKTNTETIERKFNAS